MRRFLVFMAIAALAALSAAGMASAGSNLANGTVVTWTGTNISIGGISTCSHSVLKGPITNTAIGISHSITSASFSGCSSPVQATGLPWTLTTTSQSGTKFFVQLSGFAIDWTVFGEVCQYGGTLSGGNYDNATEKWTVAGSFTSSHGFPCPHTMTTSGVYHVSPTLQLT